MSLISNYWAMHGFRPYPEDGALFHRIKLVIVWPKRLKSRGRYPKVGRLDDQIDYRDPPIKGVFGVLPGLSPMGPAFTSGGFYSKREKPPNWLVSNSRASVLSMIDLVDQ